MQNLTKLIDYLTYHLKMKMIEHLFQNIIYSRKSFFDVLVKNKEEKYEKTIEMSKNNYYATGNLLDYEYFSKHYKLVSIIQI